MTTKQQHTPVDERECPYCEEYAYPPQLAEAEAEREALRAQVNALRFVAEKALTRSAVVHPGFADEIRAALKLCEGEK